MLKVMTVVGTRPEIIRLSRVIDKLDRYCSHVLVHTGQNYDYELNRIFFDELDVRPPDHYLSAAGETAIATVANVLLKIDPLLDSERPDAMLLLGDTNSCLAVLAAKRRKIPIFHMEAGNRSFDARVPEENNRKVVDHLADVNMPYSDISRECLLREGLPPDRTIKTGSPMHEVLAHYRPKIDASQVLARLSLEPQQYFVVSCHREENVDSPVRLAKLAEILNGLADRFQRRVIVSTHPRTRNRLEASGITFRQRIELMKPLGFPDYIALQCGARAVLSDSGTISEESSILNFPAVNMRDAHERPEAMEEGAVMMTGLERERVFDALKILEDQPRGDRRLLRPVTDYTAPNVSDKVLRIILSYTDYVNRLVWHK